MLPGIAPIDVTGKLKQYLIIGLLTIIAAFMVTDYFYPKDRVQNDTLKQINVSIDAMVGVAKQLQVTADNQNKLYQSLTEQLSQRRTDREQNYNDLFNKYGLPTPDGVRTQDDGVGGKHVPIGTTENSAAGVVSGTVKDIPAKFNYSSLGITEPASRYTRSENQAPYGFPFKE